MSDRYRASEFELGGKTRRCRFDLFAFDAVRTALVKKYDNPKITLRDAIANVDEVGELSIFAACGVAHEDRLMTPGKMMRLLNEEPDKRLAVASAVIEAIVYAQQAMAPAKTEDEIEEKQREALGKVEAAAGTATT